MRNPNFSLYSVHRTLSTPVGRTPEPTFHQPPQEIEQAMSPPPPEQIEYESQNNDDPEDIPPNPWLQQLRKTKSVFR